MKDETTSNQVNIQLPPKPKDEDDPYGIAYEAVTTTSQVLRQALIESQEIDDDDHEPVPPRRSFAKPVTPKEPSAAPIVLGIILFLISVAGMISVGLWYAWPSIQKYAEGKGWTEPTVLKEPAPVMAPRVTYYHVSCAAQLETGRIKFHEFHYSMTEGEDVNPLILIHNLRQHAAQIAGSTNVMILAISHIPGGAK